MVRSNYREKEMEIEWNGIKILVIDKGIEKQIGRVESFTPKDHYPKIECLEDPNQLCLPLEDKYLIRHLIFNKNNDYFGGTMEFTIQTDSSSTQLDFGFDPKNVWVLECGEEKIYAICTGDKND